MFINKTLQLECLYALHVYLITPGEQRRRAKFVDQSDFGVRINLGLGA